jgi:aryl-alcohol dehydrogenase-like predicted oxidoreductase
VGDSLRDNAHGARRLGFGVSGPHGSALIRPEATVQMIQHAYALGVRVFDTGPSYGAGEAERRLGEALLRLPPYDPIVCTKVGIQSSGLARRHRDFTPTGVRRSVEASLKRLRRTRVDCLFLHGPAPQELTDELLKTLVDIKFKGDIVSLGICGRGKELDVALASGHFTHFMAPVHAGLSQQDKERLYRLRSAGELIGIETLSAANPRFPVPVSAGATWRLARSLMGWAAPRPPTPMTVDEALSWALGEGGAHRIITTTSRLDHLESNVAAILTPNTGRLIAGASGLSSGA